LSFPSDSQVFVKRWQVFFVVAAGVFMSTLDSSMVNLALPLIMEEFNAPLAETEWVVMVYLLTITATLLFWGSLSDRTGKSKIYQNGMLIFGFSSGGCAFSIQLEFLIFFRFLQALGASMMMATGPALIKEITPAGKLGRNLGFIGIAVSLGLMAGPSLGGLIIEYSSWRYLFGLTLPVGLVFAVLGRSWLPVNKKIMKKNYPVDWGGAFFWGASLVSMVFFFNLLPSGKSQYLKLLLSLLSILFLLAFFYYEFRTPHPLLSVKLIRKGYLFIAFITAIISFLVLFSTIMLVPFYLERVLHLPFTLIGMIMMAVPISAMLVAPVAGWLSDLTGPRYLTTIGLICSSLGLYYLSKLSDGQEPLNIALRLSLMGCGQAMFLSPNSAGVLSRISRQFTGSVAALLATARNLGMLMGIAFSGAGFTLLFNLFTDGQDLVDYSIVYKHAFILAIEGVFLSMMLIAMIGVIISWIRNIR
jgi:EmrB/QacA subfamily drug resistance transporter